ncbi:hypothetical protein D3C76_1657070 [compost metagenome]
MSFSIARFCWVRGMRRVRADVVLAMLTLTDEVLSQASIPVVLSHSTSERTQTGRRIWFEVPAGSSLLRASSGVSNIKD